MKFLTAILLLTMFFAFSCEDGNDNKNSSCEGTKMTYNGRGEEDIYIRGTFNNWQLDTPMEFIDGRWQVTLNLAPGDYAYSFYSNTSKKWISDTENPLTMFNKGVRYNRLIVKDCRYPALSIEGRPEKTENSISFKVRYTPGLEGVDIDDTKTKITLNGEKISVTFNKNNSLFEISAANLEKGKYTWLFKVFDKNGFAADPLFVPFWLEDETFSWKDGVIYQIMTDRFKDGDTSNDAPISGIDFKANWQGGDFRGIIQKIDTGYFTDMGVNAIWISSPIVNTPNAGIGMGGDTRYYSPYHSYWPIGTGWTDERPIVGLDSPIEPHFGTEADLHELISKAHEKGIRVLFDFVPNHVHTDSQFWKKHKNDTPAWFHFAHDGQFANENGGYNCGWELPIECWFTSYLADIDYTNMSAQNAVIDHLIWLIQTYDIDGLRLDAIRLMVVDFTMTLKTFIQKKVITTGIPFYMVGETFTADNGWTEIGYYLGKSKLDGQFDFPLFHHMARTFLIGSENYTEFSEFLDENDIRYQDDYYEGAIMSNFLGNHDLCRALSTANGDFDGTSQGGTPASVKVWENSPTVPDTELPFKKMTLAHVFLMTQTGIPTIYQGDEFGMPGANDPDNRRMMIFNDELTTYQKRVLDKFRILGNFRKEHKSLRYGSRKNITLKSSEWIYKMSYSEDTVFMVFNGSSESKEITFKTSLDKTSYNSLFTTPLSVNNDEIMLKLEPYTAEVIY